MAQIKLVKHVKTWIGAHKVEFVLLMIILLVASFMRLYRIADYMTFLGDEGRDVIIVRRFLTQGDIMLIGPGTSIGNMYLGPFYYYMMAPALLLAGYSPVGPAVMIALLGIITVWFIWYVGRTWFGAKAGLISAAIYSIAPTVVIYSHSSWNPNIMPFFALLCVWSAWQYWHERRYWWIAVAGFALACCLQSHYLALLLAPVVGLFWILTIVNAIRSKRAVKPIVLWTIISALIFCALMSPLVIFDFRHNFVNFKALELFFTQRQTTVSIKPWNALPGMIPQLTLISTRLLTGYNVEFGNWVALIILGGVTLSFIQNRIRLNEKTSKAFFLLAVWLGSGLLGLALYKQQIYDHYYGFLFPAFFLSIGGVLALVWHQAKIRGAWLALTVIILLVWLNLKSSPLQYQPNRQYPRSVDVASFILEKSNNQPFNFAVIAERNYEGAYQYFLESDPNFKIINPQDTKNTITTQLFVVCEMPKEKCDPTHNAKAEVANFGWSSIEQTWDVEGVNVYKLIHSIPQTSTPSAQVKK